MIGELSPAEIDEFLRSQLVARIGCHAEGVTYVVPVSYVMDGDRLIFHSTEGLKLDLMRRNDEVCVEVDRIESVVEWRSVIAWGRFSELAGEKAAAAMGRLIERLQQLPWADLPPGHSVDPQRMGLDPSLGAGTMGHPGTVYEVRLEKKTGRFQRRQGAVNPP